MQLEQRPYHQVLNGTDCQDWHRDPSPPVPAVDEEEEEEDPGSYTLPGGIVVETEMADSDNLAHRLYVDDGDDDQHVQTSSASVYAVSTYPKVQPAYQVEQPYENGLDGATIDSSRTLYAEDVDYVIDCGRQYVGNYYMPVDQEEQTRCYVMHQVYLKLFNLELTTVPLDDPKYILDIGTGIGEWAIGMAEKYPNAEVFGTDIAPIQPTQQVPFNVEFNIENAEEEWVRPADTFDLVHFRSMAGAFSDWRYIYEQTFECLRPGGWIEVLDFDDMFTAQSFVSYYPPESEGHKFFRALQEAERRAGRGGPGLLHHTDRKLLMDVGFVDIEENSYNIGIGSRENESYGKFWLFALMTGYEAVAMRLLTKVLGWDELYVRQLCHAVAQETKEIAEDEARPDGFSVSLKVIVGRKPMVPGHWTAKSLNENAAMELADYTGSGTGSGDESTIGSLSKGTIKSHDTVEGSLSPPI